MCWSLFSIKLPAIRPATLFKKILRHECFLVNTAKLLRTPILKNICEWLLLLLSLFLLAYLCSSPHTFSFASFRTWNTVAIHFRFYSSIFNFLIFYQCYQRNSYNNIEFFPRFINYILQLVIIILFTIFISLSITYNQYDSKQKASEK